MASGAVSDMFPPEQRARALVRSAMRLLVPPYTCGQGLCMLPALVGPIIGAHAPARACVIALTRSQVHPLGAFLPALLGGAQLNG